MRTGGLYGRLARLERGLTTPGPSDCESCGLPHVRLPVPVRIVEGIVAYHLVASTVPPPRLCLCQPCCAEGRLIACLTHGLPVEREGYPCAS
jgi:hypothetical protein